MQVPPDFKIPQTIKNKVNELLSNRKMDIFILANIALYTLLIARTIRKITA